MTHFKYNDGDHIGPHHILLIKRLQKDSNNKWLGLFQCPYCDQTFTARINSVQSGLTQSCGCWRIKQCQQNGRKVGKIYGGQKKKDLSQKTFGYLTALKPVGKTSANKIIWKCICKCGKEKEVVAGDLLSGRTTSCGCRIESLGEEIVRKTLKELNIKFETQKVFQNCKNIRVLPFDFYLPDYNCCIEYDGKQHYVNGWESVSEIQKRDNIKNKYCQDNNIKLIRIPYWDKDKINKKYILTKIGG